MGSSTRKGAAAILLYHRVARPATDIHGLSIAPGDFRAQMLHLRAACRVVPLQDLIAGVLDAAVPDRAVAVTFDDGYQDNYVEASPILSDVGVPATFFVTTERLNDAYEYWWDALERVFMSSGPPLPPTLTLDLPTGARALETRTEEQRVAAHWAVYHAIVNQTTDVRAETIASLQEWSGRVFSPASDHRRMGEEEIVALDQREGQEIAAHSVRHLMLPQQSPDVQEVEIRQSRRDLETLLGRQVTAFAYPFGALTATTRGLASQSFDCAVTCEPALVTADSDLWRLPRLEMRPERRLDFGEWLESRLTPP